MPAAIALFIALSALAHGHTVLKGDSAVWKGVDHQAKAERLPTTPVSYTLTTAPWYDAHPDRNGGCDFQILARVRGGSSTRLVLGGLEMLVDDNWNPRARIEGGERMTLEAWFLNPIGGETLAYRTVTFKCRPVPGGPTFVQPDMSGVR